jgi:glycosyltransferase involved in cell wall biosynthesis
MLRVLQVSPSTRGGGAERVAVALHEGLRTRGHESWIAVADDPIGLPGALPIPRAPHQGIAPHLQRAAAATLARVGDRLQLAGRMSRRLAYTGSPRRLLDSVLGHEHFDYPGSASIPILPPSAPDIIHLHNLHGDYFDLRRLVDLSAGYPVTVTLHDEWLMTGHCAYTLDCERWRSCCGSCPHLSTYPAVSRDATSRNLRVKRDIYRRSRLSISAPSAWLLDRARASILEGAAEDWRVIPNGVDQTVFRPGDMAEARRQLGLCQDDAIVLFAANRARTNEFKDLATVSQAAQRAARRLAGHRLTLVILGDAGESTPFENGEVRYVPFDPDGGRVARYFQAADLYAHAARSDNFPTTILEALSVGTPVVATAVGGVPEQVHSIAGWPGEWDGASVDVATATGILVRPGDSERLAGAIVLLLEDHALRARLGDNAAADAARRFSLDGQVESTLAWYREVLELRARGAPAAAGAWEPNGSRQAG